MAQPKAEVEITAHSRGLGARLREAGAKFRRFGGELKKNVFGKDFAKEGFGTKVGAHLVANLASSAISAGANFLVDQAKAAYQFERALTRLQITSDKSPEYMRDFAKSVREASDETGISKQKILDGARAYVALTGDMDGAAAASKQWARVAQATDSQVEDIAKTAAALKQNMKVDPSDMEAVFSALNVQGKKGAVELKDLSTVLADIAPQWAQFGRGTGVEGVRELGAAFQIVKRGFGGEASETATGIQSLLVALIKNGKRFGGVKMFDTDPKTGEKHLRNVLDIVDNIADSKLAKNPQKLEKAFGRVEAYRAFLQLRQNRGELRQLIEDARDTGSIARDLNTYLESSAGKMETGWERAKNKIAEAFTPERIDAFAESLGKAADMFASLVNAVETITGFLDSQHIDKEDQKGMVQSYINPESATGNEELARRNLKRLGDQMGVDLSAMTPAQRAAYIKAHSKEFSAASGISESATKEAVGDVERGGPYQVIQRAMDDAKKRIAQEREAAAVSKLSPEEQAQLTGRAIGLILGPQLASAIVKAMGESKTQVKIGADTVATAVKKAPQNAKKPGA